MTGSNGSSESSGPSEAKAVQAAAWWFDRMAAASSLSALGDLIGLGGDVSARGAAGSSTTLLAGVVARSAPGPVLLVVPHLDDADEAVDELLDLGLDAAAFPALEVMPGESDASLDLVGARLGLLRRVIEEEPPGIIVAPFPGLMQGVPAAVDLPDRLRVIRAGESLDLAEFSAWLTEAGWARTDVVETPGEFAVRGGLLDLFPPGGGQPVRLDLFGDEIERINEIDPASQAIDRRVDSIQLIGRTEGLLGEGTVPLIDFLPKTTTVILAELGEIVEQGRGYWERVREGGGVEGPPATLKALRDHARCILDVNEFSASSAVERMVDLDPAPLPPFPEEVVGAIDELLQLAETHDVALVCSTAGERDRATELIDRRRADGIPGADRVRIERRHVHRGFIWPADDDATQGLAVVPFHELLNRWGVRRRGNRIRTGAARQDFLRFEPGDLVVHRDHGIARYIGLGSLPRKDQPDQEVVTLEFDGGSHLHVPLSRIELVQKYIGAGSATAPPLSLLGGKRWKRQMAQVEDAVRDLAGEMLRVQAARSATPGIRFPADTDWQREFEAEFPYQETEDQVTAIAAIKRDMASSTPMDRLICGDVGFGKTEVAIRAAFKAAEFGKQVAVLVPTTVLAEQHERTFRSRFKAYPFRIESISRFKSGADEKKVLVDLKEGRVDIVIGTHRLLSKDVWFKDLGLIVIDEEQRFGVEHKQRLLAARTVADVLTLSATPIPRTLHMAMLGLRDISSLTTPPLDRRAIVTEVIPWNERRLAQAIRRELAREGQIFFVHNRVHDIESFADEIRKLAPDARILIGHGQMTDGALEKVMLAFIRREADILVSTTIIESGMDIPSANTMFVHDANRFGLAQLHQLRGRVGRSRHRAYCYLLLPEERRMTEDALRRLKAIEDYSMLGAGFRIAMRDLEIRGAGNLLGAEQSGHIASVGYDMYCRMLEDAVRDIKQDRRVVAGDTTIDIGLEGSIPKGYIPNDQRRMEAYRKIGEADRLESLDAVVSDLQNAYGEIPTATRRHVEVAEIRLASALLGVKSLFVKDRDVIFRTTAPGELQAALDGVQGSVRMIAPDGAGGTVDAAEGAEVEVYFRPPASFLEPGSLATVLRRRLRGRLERSREVASSDE
ncbi:MAG: transcription-repair coupling factor [Phycisphaeraceae bacterium]|nr:transcription-repair coupling factor [Phycisphaeraceae bacterium]